MLFVASNTESYTGHTGPLSVGPPTGGIESLSLDSLLVLTGELAPGSAEILIAPSIDGIDEGSIEVQAFVESASVHSEYKSQNCAPCAVSWETSRTSSDSYPLDAASLCPFQ